jgi:hypothetical protein
MTFSLPFTGCSVTLALGSLHQGVIPGEDAACSVTRQCSCVTKHFSQPGCLGAAVYIRDGVAEAHAPQPLRHCHMKARHEIIAMITHLTKLHLVWLHSTLLLAA